MATKCQETLWIWKDDRMIKESISYVSLLYDIFDRILLNAASMQGVQHIKVKVSLEEITIWYNLKTELARNVFDDAIEYVANFTIITANGNARTKKEFKTKTTDPTITKWSNRTSSENWNMVSFKPRLSRLNMKRFDDDIVFLMKRRVVDMAGCMGLEVQLDGTPLRRTFKDYCDLYPSTDDRIYVKLNDRWEICVGIADGHFEQVSFVNNIATMNGGSHVDYIASQIIDYLVENLNLQPNEIKKYLWVFVNAHIDDPIFDSRTLTTNKEKFELMCKLRREILEKVKDLHLSKKDFKIPKLEDAKFADTVHSQHSTLILVEGDAAKKFAMHGVSVMGKDKYGVFPLQGKVLNVRKATAKQYKENAEIQNIKKILGLRDNEVYENVTKLRYGHLMIMADQDHDGSHIKGLVINLIHHRWPSLLKDKNFLKTFITPIIKASPKNNTDKVLFFYTMREYEAEKEKLRPKYHFKYYKGLGSIEAEEDHQGCFVDYEKYIKDFVWRDKDDDNAIEVAFSSWMIEERKLLLKALEEDGSDFDRNETCIRYLDFINKDFKAYGIVTLQRSIPSMVDGLKIGQRKILHAAFMKPIIKTKTKIQTFAAYVVETMAYDSGFKNVVSSIMLMCRKYAGSNNINLLEPLGHFGTRNEKMDPAQCRYYETQLSGIIRYIFNEDDELVLKDLNDLGVTIEPQWFIPIIPMVLVNGSDGVAVGWSSHIPNYNPRDIIENLRLLLEGKEMVNMIPWYKDFKGDIIPKDANSYTIQGTTIEDENSVIITDIPIRRKEEYLEQILKKALESGDIEAYEDCDDDTSGRFKITMTKDQKAKAKKKKQGLLRKFGLITTITTTNMVLFDKVGQLKKYNRPEQIVKDFYALRLSIYKKRIIDVLRKLKKDSLILENQVKYVTECWKHNIEFPEDKYQRCANLKAHGFQSLPEIEKEADLLVTKETEKEEEVAVGEEKPQGNAGKMVKEYDYLLLDTPVLSMESKDLKELKTKLDLKKQKFKLLLNNHDLKPLWLRDLNELDKQLASGAYGYYPKARTSEQKEFRGGRWYPFT